MSITRKRTDHIIIKQNYNSNSVLSSQSPGDLPVVIRVRHQDETGPDVIEETLRSFVFLTVDLPAGHLADMIFRPLEVLQNSNKI